MSSAYTFSDTGAAHSDLAGKRGVCTLVWNKVSVAELRESLVGSTPTRGYAGRFKAACRSALHYWRQKYAKLHFMKTAYYRYGYEHPRYHAETKSSLRGETRVINGVTLTPQYSGKMVKQAQKYLPVSPFTEQLPLVFSGATRRGILEGPFVTRGSSTRVISGHWQGSGICWAWLAKIKLKGSLVHVIPDEANAMVGHIEKVFGILVNNRNTRVLDYGNESLAREMAGWF